MEQFYFFEEIDIKLLGISAVSALLLNAHIATLCNLFNTLYLFLYHQYRNYKETEPLHGSKSFVTTKNPTVVPVGV